MERVDHVDIVQIGGSSLVSQVDRVFQRQIPDREGLIFCIAGVYTAFVLMVKLGKAGCHLSASRSRCSNDNERAGCLDVLVLSVSLIAHDQRHIVRIARNRVVNVNRDAELLQSLFERVCAVLAGVLGDDNASDIEAASAELVDQTEHVTVIGDAEVAADFVFLNIGCGNRHYDLSLVGELHQHAQFGIRCKARKNAGCVEIVEQLSAEFQIQLVVKLVDAVADMLRLHFQVLLIVKSNLHGIFLPFLSMVSVKKQLFLFYYTGKSRARKNYHGNFRKLRKKRAENKKIS